MIVVTCKGQIVSKKESNGGMPGSGVIMYNGLFDQMMPFAPSHQISGTKIWYAKLNAIYVKFGQRYEIR